MPKKSKNEGQKYIASLDFDVEKAKKTLAELSKITTETSKKISEDFKQKTLKIDVDTKDLTKEQQKIAQFNAKIRLEEEKRLTTTHNVNEKIRLNAERNANDVKTAYEKAAMNTKSVFQKIGEYAQTYLIYNGFNLIKNAAKETIEEMKKVEVRMVEITRIMNDASLSTSKYRDEIIQLGQNYGRTFDETSEIVLNFARAGYNAQESISMAEKALLALNTAELDAQQATEGLISIMTQWGKNTGTTAEKAEELGNVIDMINKVADNFPLSSADLLEALKRTSSGFKLAGVDIEEAIALIATAESATKRGGKTIGTAINSMMSQLKTAGRLTNLEDLGIDVYADKAKGTYKDLIEIFSQMAEKMQELKQAGKENSVEMQTLLSAFTVLRRNIGAGMLSGMEGEDSTYFRALEVAMNASGYSAQENSKYMATLEAKLNQLQDSALKLKSAIWDNGLEDALKSLVDALSAGAKAAAWITEKVGAIPGVFALATAALTAYNKKMQFFKLGENGAVEKGFNISFKALKEQIQIYNNATDKTKLLNNETQALNKSFVTYASNLKEGETASFSGYIKSLTGATLKTIGLQAASIALNAAISFGITAAISLAVKAIDGWIHKQDELKEKIEESKNKIEEYQDELSKANDKQKEISNKITDIQTKRASGEITKAEKDYLSHLEQQNSQLQTQIDLLNERVEAEKRTQAGNVIKSLDARNFRSPSNVMAINTIAGYNPGMFTHDESGSFVQRFTLEEELDLNIRALREYDEEIKRVSKTQGEDSVAVKNLKENYDKLYNRSLEITSSFYDYIPILNEGTAAEKERATGLQQLLNVFDNYINVKKINIETDQQLLQIQDNAVDSTYSQIDSISKNIDKLTELDSVYKKVKSSQSLSAKEIDNLVNKYPDLREAIIKTSEGYGIEEEAIQKLLEANGLYSKNYIQVQIDLTKTALEEMKKRLEIFGTELEGVKTVADAYALISKNISGNVYSNDFVGPIRKNIGDKFEDELDQNSKNLVKYARLTEDLDKLQNKLNNISNIKSGGGGSGGGSGSKNALEREADDAKNALEEYKRSVEEFISADERYLKMMKAYDRYTVNDELYALKQRALNYRKFAKEIMEQTQISYEDRLALQKEYIQKAEDLEVDFYELQKKEVEDLIKNLDDAYKKRIDNQIEAVKNRADAELEAIDKLEEARDKQLEKEEYRERRRELLYGYEGVEYWSQRTGREAQLALANAKKQLAELDKEYEEKQEKDRAEKKKKRIEDSRDLEIKALQAAKENNYELAKQMGYDYIVQLGIVYEKEKQSIIDNAQRRVNEYKLSTDEAFRYAGDKSNDLFAEFKTGFTDPLKQELENVFTNLDGYTITMDVSKVGEDYSGVYTNSESSAQERKQYISDNFAAIQQIANMKNVDLGVAESMLRTNYEGVADLVRNKVSTNYVSNPLPNEAISTVRTTTSNNTSNNVNLSKGSSLVSINAKVENKTDVGYIAKKMINAIASKLKI